MTIKTEYALRAVAKDDYGIVPGSGWVIVYSRTGKRVDWPMLTTREEAVSDLNGFHRMERELASDEASEAFGLRMMGA